MGNRRRTGAPKRTNCFRVPGPPRRSDNRRRAENAQGGIAFSPDSKRVAYDAQRGVKWLVVVDGVERGRYDGFVRGAKLDFDTPKSFHTLAIRDNEFVRVEIEIVEE